MAKKDFNLADAMRNMVSDLNTGAPEVKMIPIGDIIPNPANFYRVGEEALKPLMDSIAMDGLHHYPLVMKHPDEEGKWLLVDGERRYTACKALLEEGNESFATIPCTVKAYGSAALAKLQLILSNSTNRILSGAELAQQAQETEMLFYQLKEEGHEFPGRMRDRVAAACNVSATKLAKLKVIREKLIDEYKPMWEQNKLTEQAAYALARMPDELQMRIKRVCGERPPLGHGAESILKMWDEGKRWDAAGLTCQDGELCKDSKRFLKHDLDNPWSMCYGEKCCMKCDMRRRCNAACSKAKEIEKESDEADMRAREEQQRIRSEENKKETSENAKRLLRAIEASGFDEDFIEWNWHPIMVSDIRDYAAGNFGDKLHLNVLFDPDGLTRAVQLAEQLHCSTDYLYGLTDELNGGNGMTCKWNAPENPPVAYQEVVAKFDVGTDKQKKLFVMWDGEDWCFRHGAVIDAKCVGWWPIPEDE